MPAATHGGIARRAALRGLLGLATTAALPARSASAPAVLSWPALLTPKALGAATLAVTRAGSRLVAVGERGTVLLSDDHGASWQQARVPVQATLTCVHFVDARTGWAGGHLGVILRSDDGGANWRKQLDGVQAAALVLQAAQRSGDATQVAQAQRLVDEGADKPFFDLAWLDRQRGFAVGAYNLALATEDGGTTWTPWSARLPNPKSLHLYGVCAHGNTLVVVGEQGLLLRSTDGGASVAAVASPYKGSFFGLLRTQGNALVAFGLRGSVYRSSDEGLHWDKVESGVPTTLGTGAALPGGGFVLLSQAGDVLVSPSDGAALQRMPSSEPVPVSGIAVAGDGRLVVSSLRGMRRLAALPPA